MTTGANEPAQTGAGRPIGAAVAPRRIGLDIGVQLVGRVVNLALGVVVTALLARTLGGSGFGVWSTLLAISSLVGVLGDLGLEQVALRRAAAEPELEAEWLGALVILRAVTSMVTMALCIAAVVLIAPDHEALVAGIILMLVFLTSAASSLRIVFQLRVRNSLTIAALTFQSVLWAAVVVYGYLSGAGMVFFAVGFVLATGLSSMLQGVLALKRAPILFRGVRARCGELIRMGAPIAIAGLFVLGYGRIDQILVFELAGSRSAGLYAAAYRIFDQSQFAPVSISTTMFPLLAAAFAADPRRFKALLQTSLELLLTVSMGAFALSLAYSGPIIALVYGSEFARASRALPVLIGAFVLVSIGYLQDLLVIVAGRQKRFVVAAVVALVFNIALNLALIPRWGFMAAAATTAATEALVVAMRWHILRGHLPEGPALGRIPKLALAGVALFALLGSLRWLSVAVVPALFIGAIAYPLLLFGVKAARLDDLRLVLKRES
ncbi:MAG: oligosaccharide flippase family protein [Gaiellaceae bacterium]